MLVLGQTLINIPVMSLQTSAEIARTDSAIIDPRTLKVVAYYVTGKTLDFAPAILMTTDIRETSDVGFIINSSDELMRLEDVVTMEEIISLNFTVEGKKVVDDHGRKVGKVTAYSVDPQSFVIHQLHIERPLLKSLIHAGSLINRTQIIGVNDTTITVKSPDIRVDEGVTHTAKASFHNPFRSHQPEGSSSIKTRD